MFALQCVYTVYALYICNVYKVYAIYEWIGNVNYYELLRFNQQQNIFILSLLKSLLKYLLQGNRLMFHKLHCGKSTVHLVFKCGNKHQKVEVMIHCGPCCFLKNYLKETQQRIWLWKESFTFKKVSFCLFYFKQNNKKSS